MQNTADLKRSPEVSNGASRRAFGSRAAKVMKFIMLIAGLGLFAMGAYLSLQDKTASASVTYTAGVLCLIFAYLEEFKRFKGFGFEAELLERKIEEAEDILKRLRTTSVPIAEMLFTLTARMGRLGSALPRRTRYKWMKEIERELRSIGVRDEQLDEAKRDWHLYNIFDLSRPIFNFFRQTLQEKIEEKSKALASFRQPIDAGDQDHAKLVHEQQEIARAKQEFERLGRIERIEEFPLKIDSYIRTCPVLGEGERNAVLSRYSEELEDLKYYAEHHDFRRLEAWADHQEG
jgi:hypothetical protein